LRGITGSFSKRCEIESIDSDSSGRKSSVCIQYPRHGEKTMRMDLRNRIDSSISFPHSDSEKSEHTGLDDSIIPCHCDISADVDVGTNVHRTRHKRIISLMMRWEMNGWLIKRCLSIFSN
jgi:hypothetical protein